MKMYFRLITFIYSISSIFASGNSLAAAASGGSSGGSAVYAVSVSSCSASTASVSVAVVSPFRQFAERFEFSDPTERGSLDLIFDTTLASTITSEKIIQFANRAGPRAIARFLELNKETLSDRQIKDLKFLEFIYENRNEIVNGLLNSSFSFNFSGNFCEGNESFLKKFCSAIIGKQKLPKLMEDNLTYQVYFYLGLYYDAYVLIQEKELFLKDSESKQASLLKKINTSDAKCNYAVLLEEKDIHQTWDGKDVTKNDKDRYNECKRLYRESNVLVAIYRYAVLLERKMIHQTWDRKDVTKNDKDRYNECAKLFKRANMPEAIYNYADLLERKMIHQTWDGQDVTEDDTARYKECGKLFRRAEGFPMAKLRYASLLNSKVIHQEWNGRDVTKNDIARYKECGRLYKESGRAEAIYNYAVLLVRKKIHQTWDGQDVTKNDIARYKECARLYKESGRPEAMNNYAVLLEDKKIHQTWDGQDVTEDDIARCNECARLYREANIPEAMSNCLILIVNDRCRFCYNGEVLENDQEAYQYVEKNIGSDETELNSYLRLTVMIKLLSLKEDEKLFEQAYDLYKVQCALGNEYIQDSFFSDFFNVGLHEVGIVQKQCENFSIAQETPSSENVSRPEISEWQRKKAAREQTVSLEEGEEQVTESVDDSLEDSLGDDQFEIQQKERIAAWKAYVFSSQEDKQVRKEKIKSFRLISSTKEYSFGHYRVVDKNGDDYVPKTKEIQELIADIKIKGNKGQVHALNTRGPNREILISRKITKKDRFVYHFDHDQQRIVVWQDSGHYEDS